MKILEEIINKRYCNFMEDMAIEILDNKILHNLKWDVNTEGEGAGFILRYYGDDLKNLAPFMEKADYCIHLTDIIHLKMDKEDNNCWDIICNDTKSLIKFAVDVGINVSIYILKNSIKGCLESIEFNKKQIQNLELSNVEYQMQVQRYQKVQLLFEEFYNPSPIAEQ